MKQSPARRAFGEQEETKEKIHERGKTVGWYAERGTWVKGRRKQGRERVTGYLIHVREGKRDEANNEREKRVIEGINQLESENIEAREVAEREKEREGSTLQ